MLTEKQVKLLQDLGFVHLKTSWHKTYKRNSYIRIDANGLDYYIDDSVAAENDLAALKAGGIE